MSHHIAIAAANSLHTADPQRTLLEALYALDPQAQGVTAARVYEHLTGVHPSPGAARGLGVLISGLRRTTPRLVEAWTEKRGSEGARTYYRLTPDGVAAARRL